MIVRHTYILLLFIAVFCGAVTGCGGGGGGDSGSSGNNKSGTPSIPATAANPGNDAASSPSQSTSVPQSSTPNVQPIMVAAAPGLTRNMLTTSVTICQPGTTQCATIDNIQVDTGSQGLRILASAIPASLALTAIPSGNGITGQCAVFGSGYAWGSVRNADVRMAGQLAASIPVQLIADPALPAAPADCAASGLAMLDANSLRANGILGIGLFAADCGSGCVTAALPRWYYTCDTSGTAGDGGASGTDGTDGTNSTNSTSATNSTSGTCQPSTQALAQQVTNPVSRFPLDNNGVVIDLPALADGGAASVAGSLIFGIDTQANNTLNGTTVLKTNQQTGYVSTVNAGRTYSQSYIDSGSNGLFFASTDLTQCGFWYCPSSTQTVSATISGTDGTASTVSFGVGNARTLFASTNNAFDNLAGIASNSFGWGLPFFFGRRVYAAIASRTTSVGAGPFYAF